MAEGLVGVKSIIALLFACNEPDYSIIMQFTKYFIQISGGATRQRSLPAARKGRYC
jgi:hypothetical protein